MRWLKEQSLTIFFGLILLGALVGQALAGLAAYNAEQRAGGFPVLSMGRYLLSADFAADVTENWQSEYLQFTLMIVATVWFVQRGSTESKPPEEAGQQSDRQQKIGAYAGSDSPHWARVGGWRTALFSRSLLLMMGLLFLATWFVQSFSGWVAYDEDRLGRLQEPISWGAYLLSADFWSRSLQNWQSEFLAVGSMAAFSIFLRMRGSSESKRVGEPHDATGS